eukprot:scaffold25109_cov101-Isochrysis_galbana.AAC.2
MSNRPDTSETCAGVALPCLLLQWALPARWLGRARALDFRSACRPRHNSQYHAPPHTRRPAAAFCTCRCRGRAFTFTALLPKIGTTHYLRGGRRERLPQLGAP